MCWIIIEIERMKLISPESKGGHEGACPIGCLHVDHSTCFQYSSNFLANSERMGQMFNDMSEYDRVESLIWIREILIVDINETVTIKLRHTFGRQHVDAVELDFGQYFSDEFSVLAGATSKIKDTGGALKLPAEFS